jgi:hypothetical protein
VNWRYEGKAGGIYEHDDGSWTLVFSDYAFARLLLEYLMRLVGGSSWEGE